MNEKVIYYNRSKFLSGQLYVEFIDDQINGCVDLELMNNNPNYIPFIGSSVTTNPLEIIKINGHETLVESIIPESCASPASQDETICEFYHDMLQVKYELDVVSKIIKTHPNKTLIAQKDYLQKMLDGYLTRVK